MIVIQIDFWSHITTTFDPIKAAIHPKNVEQFRRFLTNNGIKYEVIGNQSKIIKRYFQRDTETFDYETKYYNLDDIYKELDRLSKQYSDRLSVLSFGKSFENRDIMAVNMKSNSGQNRTVVFECGIHAREWISTAFCMWSINKLINDTRLLDHYQFIIIPVLNPDGY